MIKYFKFSLLLILICINISTNANTLANQNVANQNKLAPTEKNTIPTTIDKILVEKTFKQHRFSHYLFILIKQELTTRNFNSEKINLLTGKIYWEIMQEYANAFQSAKLTPKNLYCFYDAHKLPEAAPFIGILSIQNYAQDLKDTALKKKLWPLKADAPTFEQVESIFINSTYKQHVLDTLVSILKNNNLAHADSDVDQVYVKSIAYYQYLLSKNGANKNNIQKFVEALKKEDCINYLVFFMQYTKKAGFKLITDKIK